MEKNIVPFTDRVIKMLVFLNKHNIKVDFHYNKGDTARLAWESKSKKIIRAKILLDPNSTSPVNSDELRYIYSLAHEFGHIHDSCVRNLNHDDFVKEKESAKKRILQENNAWHYGYKLLIFIYPNDKIVLSEFNKEYEYCMGCYLDVLKDEI